MAFVPLSLILPRSVDVRPSRILDQHFGLGLTPEDLVAPFVIPRESHHLSRSRAGYLRPWRTQSSQDDVGSTVHFDKGKFEAKLDVQQFAPEDITVKVTGENEITIEGKHEEKEDEHGFISRHFVRKYYVPKGCNIDQIESKLSSDGVLSITVPRVEQKQIEHREVPVIATGQPSKPVEGKKAEGGDKN